MDEEHVLRVADFYNDTRTWRKELELTGYHIHANTSMGGNTILIVEEDPDSDHYYDVELMYLGDSHYRVTQRLVAGDEDSVDLDTPEEVMTYISEALRHG
jgi:hypothetical protein